MAATGHLRHAAARAGITEFLLRSNGRKKAPAARRGFLQRFPAKTSVVVAVFEGWHGLELVFGSEAVAPTAILSTSGNASRRFLGLVDTAARTRSTQGLLAVSAAKIQMMFCVGELIQPNENP